MDNAQVWKECFANWPPTIDRSGIVVTNLNEQIPFSGFMTSETMVLLARQTPDNMGTREILLPYHNVAALKITDVVKPKAYTHMGFQGRLSGR